MTTTITVDAHAGWPVGVSFIDPKTGLKAGSDTVVPAGDTRDFHIHDCLSIRCDEMAIMSETEGEAPTYHPAPVEFTPEELAADPILKFFHYGHLPPKLQDLSRPFCQLAARIIATTPRNAERSAGLRKLLETKDCVVRSGVPD